MKYNIALWILLTVLVPLRADNAHFKTPKKIDVTIADVKNKLISAAPLDTYSKRLFPDQDPKSFGILSVDEFNALADKIKNDRCKDFKSLEEKTGISPLDFCYGMLVRAMRHAGYFENDSSFDPISVNKALRITDEKPNPSLVKALKEENTKLADRLAQNGATLPPDQKTKDTFEAMDRKMNEFIYSSDPEKKKRLAGELAEQIKISNLVTLMGTEKETEKTKSFIKALGMDPSRPDNVLNFGILLEALNKKDLVVAPDGHLEAKKVSAAAPKADPLTPGPLAANDTASGKLKPAPLGGNEEPGGPIGPGNDTVEPPIATPNPEGQNGPDGQNSQPPENADLRNDRDGLNSPFAQRGPGGENVNSSSSTSPSPSGFPGLGGGGGGYQKNQQAGPEVPPGVQPPQLAEFTPPTAPGDAKLDGLSSQLGALYQVTRQNPSTFVDAAKQSLNEISQTRIQGIAQIAQMFRDRNRTGYLAVTRRSAIPMGRSLSRNSAMGMAVLRRGPRPGVVNTMPQPIGLQGVMNRYGGNGAIPSQLGLGTYNGGR